MQYSQNTYLTSDPSRGRVLLSVITCGLCCLIVLWFGFFPLCVCVLEDGVAGPDTGNNTTGNWAALSKICFSSHHHTGPAKMVLEWWGWVISVIHIWKSHWLNKRPLRINRNNHWYLTRLFWLNCGFSFVSDNYFVIIPEMLVGRDLLNSFPSFLSLSAFLPFLKVQGSGIKSTKGSCQGRLAHRGCGCVSLCSTLPFPAWGFREMII